MLSTSLVWHEEDEHGECIYAYIKNIVVYDFEINYVLPYAHAWDRKVQVNY